VHSIENRDADIHVVVKLDVMLALVGAKEPSTYWTTRPLNASGKARNRVSALPPRARALLIRLCTA
jgi:hypothetical protein